MWSYEKVWKRVLIQMTVTNEMYGLENRPIYEEITWFKIFLIRYENLFTEKVFCEKFFKNKHTLKKLTLCFTEIE